MLTNCPCSDANGPQTDRTVEEKPFVPLGQCRQRMRSARVPRSRVSRYGISFGSNCWTSYEHGFAHGPEKV